MKNNIDVQVVEGFGDEWTRFNQSEMSEAELIEIFNCYFESFPWDRLPKNSIGFDLGCGSGRWAKFVAPKVGTLHCIDASQSALGVAQENLKQNANCKFHHASVDSIPLEENSCDFGYSLGVLHHIPDTLQGIKSCVLTLKEGSPFLIYLYYSFDNRPFWYRALWSFSEIGRIFVSHLPLQLRYLISQIIAFLVYLPVARLALVLEKVGMNVCNFPLTAYRDKSFYVMRTDALDRFGTRLEKRFSRREIREMLEQAGLENIRFSEHIPYWCAIGYKKSLTFPIGML